MRNFAISLVLILLAGCSEPIHPDSSETDSKPRIPDSQFVLGDWEIIDAMRDGTNYPSQLGGTTTFAAGSAIIKTTDAAETTYAVTFDQTKTPRQIDWSLAQDGVTMTLHGLYEIQDGLLITCSPPNFNMDRPSEIKTTHGDGRWVFKLRRIEPAKQSQ